MAFQAMEQKFEDSKQELINFIRLFGHQLGEFYKQSLSHQETLRQSARATSVSGGKLNPSPTASELMSKGFDQRLSRELKANQELIKQFRSKPEGPAPEQGPSRRGPSGP